MESNVLYREVQRLDSPLLMGGVLLVALGLVAFWLFAMYRSVVSKKPLGNLTPVSTLAMGIPFLVLGVSLATLFLTLNLTTEVRDDGLYVQLFPLHMSFQEIPLDGLEDYEVRTYSPIREYGGWGIRSGSKGMAYNIAGDQGLQLTFSDQAPILVGTSDPSGLLDAFDQMVRSRR